MSRCLHKLRSCPILLALLVMPGFLIRATVPPGFMPVAGPDAPLTMAMCPGHAQAGLPTSNGASMPRDHDPPGQERHEAPCIYAATAGGAPPTLVPATAFVQVANEVLVLPPAVAPATPQSPRAHPPRAPPANA